MRDVNVPYCFHFINCLLSTDQYAVTTHDCRGVLDITIFEMVAAECIFLLLLLLLLLLTMRFSAIVVAVLPSALNRRNAEMQLKRSRRARALVARARGALMHRSMPLTSITT